MFEEPWHRPGGAIVLEVDRAEVRAARIDSLVRLQQWRSWIDSMEQAMLAEIAVDPGDSPEWLAKNLARAEVACALRIPEPVAEAKLHNARELLERFPATLAALGVGDISMVHARILTEACADLDEATAGELEAAVLPRAANQTAAAFRRSVHRARARLAPELVEDRHARATADRDVRAQPLPDGMGQLTATISAEDTAAVMDVLNGEAQRLISTGDQRSVRQLRADTLVDRILGRSTTNPVSSGGASVQVIVALSTLTGADDQPGELAGYGPIPASMARRIAAQPDSVWRRLVTDELGRLIDYGRTTYRPPVGLADFVRAWDQRCVFPTCHRRGKDCDLDHLLAWQDGGDTQFENLAAECPRHHQVKHEADWTVERLPDGAVRWTAPSGHEYDRLLDPLPIDQTTELISSDPDPPAF